MEIIFTDTIGVNQDFKPTPALTNLPSWYVELESYIGAPRTPSIGSQTGQNGTAKRCMPMFDAITSGYIIYSFVDIYVSQKEQLHHDNIEKLPFFSWPSNNFQYVQIDPIQFHSPEQLKTHFKNSNMLVPKFINPWAIKTPKGYSCFFLNPKERDLPFSIFEGVVDTDKFIAPVNFPFVLKDPSFEGMIPAGTPLVQVFPFKRDKWKMILGKDKERKESADVRTTLLSKFFDAYKSQFRQVKEYK